MMCFKIKSLNKTFSFFEEPWIYILIFENITENNNTK